MRYTIKVASGPGTSGYDKLTPTQRKKETSWAAFTLYSDAHDFAAKMTAMHPTWIVRIHDRERLTAIPAVAFISCPDCETRHPEGATCDLADQRRAFARLDREERANRRREMRQEMRDSYAR